MSKPWRSTSPSQLSTFQDCARKWWRVSVNGERPPSTAAAERGSKIHEELENYLMHGREVSDGTARAMLSSLPPAGSVPSERVEVGFEWKPDGWPVPIRGRVDLVEAVGGVELAITDHKTTASLQYAKSERDLKRDPQALVYSAAALQGALEGIEAGRAERVRFRLLYGTTRPPYQVRSVARVFEGDELLEGVERLGERVNEQAQTSEAPAWVDVFPNYGSCDKFGGCPFLKDCRAAVAAPVVEVKKLSGESVNDWLSALRRRASDSVEPVEVVEPVEPSAQELSERYGPAPFEVGDQYASINPPDGLPDGEPLPVEESAPKRRKIMIDGKSLSSLKAGEAQEAVNLYEMSLSPELLAAYREAAQGLSSTLKDNRERLKLLDDFKSGRRVVDKSSAAGFDLFSSPVDVVEPAPVDVVEPEAVAVEPEPVAVEPVPVPPPSRDARAVVAPSVGRVLLVDCHASGAVDGEAALAPLIAEIGHANGVPVPLMDYARGWVLVAFEIERRGWAHVFGGASVVRFDSASPVYKHGSYTLLAQASFVVRGTR